jgi:predicted  nucleic acid-binding Zn-ribbon protein
VDQNSTLKKEAGTAERKLLARNERIQNLEALLQDADRRLSVQNQKFEAQLQAVKERLDQARGMSVNAGVELSLIALMPQHKKPPPHRRSTLVVSRNHSGEAEVRL